MKAFSPRSKALAVAAVALYAYPGLTSASTLSVDTSHPDSSTFATGESVVATFTGSGLAPNSASTITIVVKDEHDAVIGKSSVAVSAGADGTFRAPWTAPSDRLGFYRVFPTLADGTTLAKISSRKAGYFTYAIVPDPAKRADYGAAGSFFGMQGGFNKDVNVIPYLGVRWILGGYGWSQQEKDHPGEFAENIAAAKAKGQPFPPISQAVEDVWYQGKRWNTFGLPSLNGVPKWAEVPGTGGTAQSVINQASEGKWSAYTELAAKQFATLHPAWAKRYIQVTWEPVYPWGFKGTDEQLIRTYQLAYPAIRKGDPNALVIGPTGGGIGEGDVEWAERLLKAGLGKYLDGFAIHPYFPLPPEQNGLIDRIDSLKSIIRQYVGRDLPLFGTEQGYATGEDPEKEIIQAEGLVRENLILLGEGFRLNFAFYVHDYPGEPGYGFYYNLSTAAFGANKVSPKPVVPAYANMTNLLDGHKPVQRIEWMGATALGYAYQRGPDVVLALWDYGVKPRSVTLPVGKSPVQVFDMMGNSRTLAPSAGGQATVTLTPDPIYIKGVAADIWGSEAKRPLVLSQPRMNVFPGQKVALKASLSSPTGKAVTGRIVVTPDSQIQDKPITVDVKLTAKPLAGAVFLPLPADLPVGRYMARVALEVGGASVAAGGVLLNVQAPIAVSDVHAAFANGQPAVTARLTNLTGAALAASSTLRIAGLPGKRPEAAVNLAGGSSRLVTYDVSDLQPDNDHIYTATIAITTATGYKSANDVTVTFSPVVYASSAPKLDAVLADWPGQPVTVEGRSRLVRSPQYYNPVLAAKAKFTWDTKNLYLAFDVTDPTHYQPFTGFDTWKGDCLQLEFNLDPGKKAANTGNAVADSGSLRHTEIDIALTKNGPEAYRTMSYDPAKLPVRLLTASEVSVSVSQLPAGLRYRMAIPWTSLGAASVPFSGQRIGFAAYVNDANNATQLDPSALGMYVDSNTKDPSKFGELVLTSK
ncbi:MAG TPA: sugar-binding protein [Capsulimonadaceae bacterium]|jgi:hypothetical protein